MRELALASSGEAVLLLGKAVRVLDWQTRPTKDTIPDTARSLLAIDADRVA